MEVEESTSSTAAVSSKEDNSSLVVGVVAPASASEEKQNEIDDKASNTKEDVDLRDAETRPLFRLSVKLVDTYKYINKVYYEAKAKKLREQGNHRGGVHNDGYDDAHYDYIICGDELFADRYILKHKMGKVCPYLKSEIYSKVLCCRALLAKWSAHTTGPSKLMWQ